MSAVNAKVGMYCEHELKDVMGFVFVLWIMLFY